MLTRSIRRAMSRSFWVLHENLKQEWLHSKNKTPKHKRFKRTVFIRTNHSMQIFGLNTLTTVKRCKTKKKWDENNIAQPKTGKGLSSAFIFIYFYRLTAALVSFCNLIKGITPKIRMLWFVLINSILLNLSCLWVLSFARQGLCPFLLDSEWSHYNIPCNESKLGGGICVSLFPCVRT